MTKKIIFNYIFAMFGLVRFKRRILAVVSREQLQTISFIVSNCAILNTGVNTLGNATL